MHNFYFSSNLDAFKKKINCDKGFRYICIIPDQWISLISYDFEVKLH